MDRIEKHAEIIKALEPALATEYIKKMDGGSVKVVSELAKRASHPHLHLIPAAKTLPQKRKVMAEIYKLHGKGFGDWLGDAWRSVKSVAAPLVNPVVDLAKDVGSKLVVDQAKKAISKLM